MRKITLMIAVIALVIGCEKSDCEPKKNITKAQIDSIFRTKLIMKK